MRAIAFAILAALPAPLAAQQLGPVTIVPSGPSTIPAAPAAPEVSAMPEAPEAAEPEVQIAGMGGMGCEAVTGIDNLSMLAAATDWSLGYLAGRQDAGHLPTDETVLSVTDPADVAVSIRLYCNEFPYALVIDALRDYGTRAFAQGPAAEPSLQPRLPRIRPRERPVDWPPVAQTQRPELVVAASDAWIPAIRPIPRPLPVDAVLSTRSATEDAPAATDVDG